MTFTELQKYAGNRLGFSFTVPADLNANDRERLYDEMARVIHANQGQFSEGEVAYAKKRMASGWYENPIKEYTLTQKISDFGEEVVNQAVSINENINPFSQSNRGKLFTLVVAGLAVYFLAPVIFDSVAKYQNARGK
jgi:hypothetical protein